MLRIAFLGTWHVHTEAYAEEFNRSGLARVTDLWVPEREEGLAFQEKFGVRLETDLDLLLADESIDAVCCFAPTTQHKELLIAAARAGKHIFTEKVLAPTMAECMDVSRAIRESGVTFCIALPFKARADVLYAKKLVDRGELGRLISARFRSVHGGALKGTLPEYWFEEADAAGGAMMDLGAHPMCLLAHFCGLPKRITGIFSSPLGRAVDENAVALAEFENGLIGIAETSFDAYCENNSFEICGTEGIIRSSGGKLELISERSEEYCRGFIVPDLPEAAPSPVIQFLEAVADGEPSPQGMGLSDALTLTELLECAYIANNNSSVVSL